MHERERERERQGKAKIQYLQRDLLLHSASIRLAQGQLKTFSHLCFFFMLLSQETDAGLPLHQGASGPSVLETKMAWCLVSLLTLSADCSVCPLMSQGCKFLGCPHTLPTQCIWHFHGFLFTLRHRCITCLEIHSYYGQSKVNMEHYILNKSWRQHQWNCRCTATYFPSHKPSK